MRRIFALMPLLLAGGLLIGSAFGLAPELISFRGELTDGSGAPVPDGAYDITFSVFDSEVGGERKWSETQTGVPVTNGVFSVLLGSVVPISDTVWDGRERFLEIQVGAEILSPRSRFASVPWAQRIGTVDEALGGTINGGLLVRPDANASIRDNSITIVNEAGEPQIVMETAELGVTELSMFEPADSKFGFGPVAKKLSIQPDSIIMLGEDESPAIVLETADPAVPELSMFEPADSKFGEGTKRVSIKPDSVILYGGNEDPQIVMETADLGVPELSMFEPADSKAPGEKRIAIRPDALIMFGESIFDTTLIVRSNGDITALGQLTMGQNSSPGIQTSVLGFENTANGDSSTIGGGSQNTTNGTISTISGGHQNTANGEGSTIGGGAFNTTDGDYSAIAGGYNNNAGGDYSMIPGGQDNTSDGDWSQAGGHRAMARHNGTFVWADQMDEDFASTGDDQFIVRAGGGVGINTNMPLGVFDVAGPAGDLSVNLPDGSIGPRETNGEAGMSMTASGLNLALTQGANQFEDIVSTRITIPTAGYIIVDAGVSLKMSGTTGPNVVKLQIDETPGGGINVPYFIEVGLGAYAGDGSEIHSFAAHTKRIYFKEAGDYKFRLEGRALDNGDGAVTLVTRPYITAMFVPSSYGEVKTLIANSAEAGQFDAATPVSVVDDELGSQTMYEVDLRDLELKAAQAQAEAERARRELLQAQARLQNNR